MSNKTKIQGHNTALESLKNILTVPMEKHGMYVWRKFKYEEKVEVTNPSFTINFVSGSSYVDITNANFDLRKIDKTKVALEESPLVGFSNNGSTPKISWVNNSYVVFAIGSNVQHISTLETYTETTGRITFAGVLSNATNTTATIAYSGTKTLKEAQKGDFLEFVVSDIESAYPDGGLKDGYWYERFSLDIKSFGCTKHAVDSFVLTSDIAVGSYFINHSLGSVPIFAMLSTDDESGTPNYIKYGFVLGYDDNVGGKKGCCGLFAMDGGDRFAGTTSTANKQQVSIAYSSAKYKAGVKYTLVTMG